MKLLIFMSVASVARMPVRKPIYTMAFSMLAAERCFPNRIFSNSVFSGNLNCSTVCATVTVLRHTEDGESERLHSLNTLSGGKWLLLNIFTQRTVKKCIGKGTARTKNGYTTYIMHAYDRHSACSPYNSHAPTRKYVK